MTDTREAPSVGVDTGADGKTTFVPRTELDARFEAINLRIGIVERTTTAMAQGQADLISKFDANTKKLDDILGFMSHANTWLGFLKKHGPKAGYLFLGIAISRGWISAENGKNLLAVFVPH